MEGKDVHPEITCDDHFVDVLILKAIDQSWESYDTDGDNRISKDEARKLVHEMFPELENYVSKAEIDSEFKAIDQDGDGKVSRGEMAMFIHHIANI